MKIRAYLSVNCLDSDNKYNVLKRIKNMIIILIVKQQLSASIINIHLYKISFKNPKFLKLQSATQKHSISIRIPNFHHNHSRSSQNYKQIPQIDTNLRAENRGMYS